MSDTSEDESFISGDESESSFETALSEKNSDESSSEEEGEFIKSPPREKKQTKSRKRIQTPEDSSDDEQNSQNNTIEPSESEEVPRKSLLKGLVDTDTSSDDEDKKRKSLYEAESESEDEPIEEKAFSKATRRSINGFKPRSSIIPNSDDSSDSEDIIVSETEDEAENDLKKDENANERSKFENSYVGEPTLSSTLRSPLKEISSNLTVGDSGEDSFEKSHKSEASGGVKDKKKVSRSEFEAVTAEKEKMQQEVNSILKMQAVAKSLPDGGQKLQLRMNNLLDKIAENQQKLSSMEIDENKSIKNEIARSFHDSVSTNDSDIEVIPNEQIPLVDLVKVDDVKPHFTGVKGIQKFYNQKQLTVESLEQIKESLDGRPGENVLATPPKHLKVELMKHQLHAISFMTWRESQKPRGGILADDMGLGKTLTTISLIMKQLQDDEEREEESSDDDEEETNDQSWKTKGRKDMRNGGTLIICPASLVKQWEHEIKTKTKRGALDHNVFHGPKRIYKPRELSKFDVVITSYQIVVSELKADGCLFQVKWRRVVLDEGHVIRNHKSKQSEAVCTLKSKFRWVLTGTPIQNKEFDLYAAVKFLRCSPFDELTYWKQFIEVKNSSSPRVQLLLKSILLRRTKQQLMDSGEVSSLPEKSVELFHVEFNREERFIYNRLMSLSQAIFANFLKQQQEKNNEFNYDQNHLGKMYKQFARKFNVDRDIQSHEILTLLLRLRQACCHPGLIKSMLDRGDINSGELEGAAGGNDSACNESGGDLLKQLENLNIEDENEAGSPTNHNRWSVDNEIFSMDLPSSKIIKMMDVLKEQVLETSDKAIIVSQWTGYLEIIRGMLEVEGVTYCELNGKVAVKDRNDIVVNFNNPNSGIKIMLLSLTAGGVGLNLVGANYLFLMDLHWNPQLEQQAQDRIYRFGQNKNVKIFKFVCAKTIEEGILSIQEKKLEIAASSLTGAKSANGSKLTMNDLKALFNME